MIHSFNPIMGKAPKVLVLGSMPSVVSLQEDQYYGHPRNQFWPMIAHILDADFPKLHTGVPYEEKKQMLVNAHIAVWDVLKSCDRDGSLDSDIRNEHPNDLEKFLKENPTIRLIVLNGGKAESSFKKSFKTLYSSERYTILKMPSTSPAYTLKFEDKLKQWMKMKAYL